MYAQNLVTNPSFEVYSSCPDNWGEIDRLSNWFAYKGSPDYFNSCELSNTFSTPQNIMGFQTPKSGNSYAGLIFYSRDSLNADEIVGTQLLQPLQVGNKYFVSFEVVLKYNNPYGVCCANNKIGAKFSTNSYFSSNPPIINNAAHVWTDSVISDTLNWNKIFGSFIADSVYNYLMIGNFFSDSNIIINDIITSNDFGYYFLDNVCVSLDSSYCANYIYTGVEVNNTQDKLLVYPNPAKGYVNIQNEEKHPYDIRIFNSLGVEIFAEQNISMPNREISLLNFSRGMLLFSIIIDGELYNFKILKQ